MPVLRLTDLAIQRLPPAGPHVTYWDDALPGFGIRIGKHSRTFVVMKGRNRRRVSLGRYPLTTLKDARTRAHALMGDFDRFTQKAGPKASQVVAEYLAEQSKKTRANTSRTAHRILTKHFIPKFTDQPLAEITTRQLTVIINNLMATPSEAIKAHAIFSAFFNWSLRQEYVDRNPLAGIPLPAKPLTRDRVLTDQELAAILKAACRLLPDPYAQIIFILAHTALRKNEAYTLCWTNITKDTITIPKEIAKNHREHVLPNIIAPFLETVQQKQNQLFPLNINWIREKQRFDRRCGVKGWVLHDLRRTLSTKMAEWEIAPPDVVEAILNHVSGSRSPVSRIYDRHNRLPQMRKALLLYADRLHGLTHD